MRRLWKFFTFILCVFALMADVPAQTPSPSPAPAKPGVSDIGITPTLALGDVTAIDAANRWMTLRTKDGNITVLLSDQTVYKRVAPGETDLRNAVPVTLADIGVGDRVIAMGRVSDDRRSIPARQIILMTKADIAKKQERDREEWRRRGIAGRVTALDAEKQEITISTRSRDGEQLVTITDTSHAVFRRYAPDSVKFSDAQPSSFAELNIGDQLRALGDRSEDGLRFRPEEIVFGSFRTVGGRITQVDAARQEIVIDDLETGKPLTIVVNSDSLLRRLPTEMAAMMARFRAMQQAAGPGGASPGQTPPSRASGPGTMSGGPAGGPMRGRMGGDLDEMIERLPSLTLAELKPSELIVASSTLGADPTRVTAIKLLTGVEALLVQPSGRPSVGPSFTLPGLDTIGLP